MRPLDPRLSDGEFGIAAVPCCGGTFMAPPRPPLAAGKNGSIQGLHCCRCTFMAFPRPPLRRGGKGGAQDFRGCGCTLVAPQSPPLKGGGKGRVRARASPPPKLKRLARPAPPARAPASPMPGNREPRPNVRNRQSRITMPELRFRRQGARDPEPGRRGRLPGHTKNQRYPKCHPDASGASPFFP